MDAPVKALLFDLGNVLLPFDHGRMVSQIAALFGASDERVRQVLMDHGLLVRAETGRADNASLHRELCDTLGVEVEKATLMEAASDIFTPDEGMRSLVRWLAGRYRLVLLSNTSAPHVEFIRRRFDVLEPFDALTLSYEVGASKPEPAIFEAALRHAGVPATQCFYTDDIPDYVHAAAEHGIRGHVFDGRERLIESMREAGIDC